MQQLRTVQRKGWVRYGIKVHGAVQRQWQRNVVRRRWSTLATATATATAAYEPCLRRSWCKLTVQRLQCVLPQLHPCRRAVRHLREGKLQMMQSKSSSTYTVESSVHGRIYFVYPPPTHPLNSRSCTRLRGAETRRRTRIPALTMALSGEARSNRFLLSFLSHSVKQLKLGVWL